MIFKIADGSNKDIVAGSQVTIKTDFTPRDFAPDYRFTVTKIDQGYPFVLIQREEKRIDDDGTVHNTVTEESAVTPSLITGVF